MQNDDFCKLFLVTIDVSSTREVYVKKKKYKITPVLSAVPSVVASFVPLAVVHSIPITMSIFSFLRFSAVFVFSAMSFGSHGTSTLASRSTSALRQWRPTPFPRFFSFVAVYASVGSRLLPNVLAVVLPRTRSFFFIPSSGRASSTFTLATGLLFLRAFIAAVGFTPAGIVGADWYAVTSWSTATSASCSASRTAPRAAIDWRSAATASSGDWATKTR